MGRRKERRLAAKAAAGRRVKLDLFIDPSPAEASLNEGIGGENRDQQTVVPTSPSSGCDCCLLDKENPLALLGQYSDDEEEDEEAADQPTAETKESPKDASALVAHECDEAAGDKGEAQTELSVSVADQQGAPQVGDVKNYTSIAEENTVASEPTLENECAVVAQAIPDSSGMQIVGDIGGNWKAVMHEHSNQCYYWNTITGETSWEIPNGLTSGVASASIPTCMDYSMEAQAHVLPHNTLQTYPSDVSVVNGITTYANLGMECAQVTQDAYAYAAPVISHESMDIDPLHLSKFGEDLLRRLKLLERLHGSGEGLELIGREIEIRISDCNALSSYGSSLLPLWLHIEVHLKQLESSISKLEASYCTATDPGHLKTEVSEHKAANEADVTVPSSPVDLKSGVSAGATIDENVVTEEPASTLSAQNSQDRDGIAIPSKVESDDDVDMDIEMEVDDGNVEEPVHSSSPAKEHPPSEQLNSPNLPLVEGPAAPQDNDIPPPPPEEEWIPPPPVENEAAPPPPPPENEAAPPPEDPVTSYVHADTVTQSYIGQASVGYTLSGMEYYSAGGSEGTNANIYIQASGPHVLQAQQHSYYAPVSASGISVPVDGASIAPESYYTYPSVTIAACGVAPEHSGYYASSVSAISSSAVDIRTNSASVISANSNLDSAGSDKVISKDASVAPMNQAAVATSAAGTTSMLGSSQVSTGTANQTKVVRSKKRAVSVTSSLRSNKKVSSLVDKWKAAKEELREEEEEEPESALEALERKRQKEIEQWRKQQIASGEAQGNANFVPVRGDWRDRVKCRRAEAKEESKNDAASISSSELHKGPPDLAELSKGLPSGWQAYMDEATKQVYYGNSLTSETTWERPTK